MRKWIGYWAVPVCVVLLLSPYTAYAQTAGTYEFEFAAGSTANLPGSRAIVTLSDGFFLHTADSGEHTSLPSVSFALTRWGRTIGSFVDFSFIDGGKASASLDGYSADVTSYVFDFHGGLQAQMPGGRVRPYVSVAGGFARSTTETTFLFDGVGNTASISEWLSSITYGAGLRLDIREGLGVRTGFEGVTVTPMQSESLTQSTTYGRFMIAVYWSGKSSPATQPGQSATAVSDATGDVRQAIADIRRGAHGTLPPAQFAGTNPGGRTTLAIRNSTAYTLQYFLSGGQTATLTLAPGETQTIAIEAGKYEIAARVSASDVLPFYGTQTFERGGGYTETFFITSR